MGLTYVTTLAESMTPNPVTIAPQSRAIDALRVMSDNGFRHLPVVENGRIWGRRLPRRFQGDRARQAGPGRAPLGMHPLITRTGLTRHIHSQKSVRGTLRKFGALHRLSVLGGADQQCRAG